MGKVVLISSFAIIVNADMISSFLEGKTVVFDFYKEVADAKRAEEAEYYPSLYLSTHIESKPRAITTAAFASLL